MCVLLQETVKRSPSRGSQESGPSPPGKKDSELEVILRRRRNKAGEAGSGGSNLSPSSSSVLRQQLFSLIIYNKTFSL